MNTYSILIFCQKFQRPLFLALLLMFGLACGQLLSTIMGLSLHSDEPVISTRGPLVKPSVLRTTSADLKTILEQNIFDPNSRGITSPPITNTKTVKKAVKAAPRDVELIGTLVSGDKSTALINVSREIRLFRLGDPFPDNGKVETIERNLVTIRFQDQTTTELHLLDKSENSSRSARPLSSGEKIKTLGKNRWQVSRDLANSVRVNISDQLRLAKMEPRIVNGRTNGFLVRELNKKSLLTQMGLRVGDVVMKVNNMSLNSPEKALQILQQLREARQLSVDLERGGKPMTFSYEIN